MKYLFSIFITLMCLPFFVLLFLSTAQAIDITVLSPILIDWAVKNPKVASFLIFMGSLRLYLKPTVSFIRKIIVATPTQWDDTILDKVQKKTWFKILAYILDWLTSIKIDSKKKIEKQVNSD